MTQASFWLGRVRYQGKIWTVRVQDTQRLPSSDSQAELIEDPFADPAADAWAGASQAPAHARIPLAQLEAQGEPLVPVRPGKIIGIGRNFRAHAKELNNEVPAQPLLFFKPSSALILDGAPLSFSPDIGRVDMEAELVLLIGRPGKHIHAEQAGEHIAGLLLGNDISARALQASQPRWVRAKGADGFAPIGRWIRMEPGLPPDSLRVQGWHNEVLVQDAPISQFVFSIPELLADISSTMRLESGDLIFTGTPSGVCELTPGSTTTVGAQGLCLAGVRTPVR